MRARLRLAFVLFLFCAGCRTFRHAEQTGRTRDGSLSLSDDEFRFASALAHYSQGLICQDRFNADSPETVKYLTEAATNFSVAIEMDPETLRLYPALAVSYLSLKETDKAIEALKKACLKSPGNSQPLIDLAVACEKTGRMGEAITYFREAIKVSPRMDGLYRELALIYFQQKKNKEALNLLKEGIAKVSPPDAIVTFCFNFGKLHESVGLEDHAIEFYKLAGTSKKQWPDPFIRIAAIYMKNNIPKALQTIDHALKTMPNEPKLLFLLGLLYSADKQFEKAIEAFKRTEKTVETAGTESEKAKLNPVFYINYGSAFEKDGKYSKAEEVFRKCINMYPDSHEVLNYLAYMWAERGEKLEEGLKHVNKAIELNPDNGAYIDTLGWIYYKQKKYDKALEQIQKARELIKNDPTITEHLGDIYFALNDKQKALLHWKQSFIMDQNNKSLVEKLKQNGMSPEQIRKELEDRIKGNATTSSEKPGNAK
ncbi:MAG: tetratricopeptide repeat protein [Kiritimatiellae bacterium]|nr:tetratricopeptide repeat protein [Kiritimatiellia bacterium]